LEFLVSFIKKYGYSPMLSEITRAVGVSSMATVSEHLDILERKGLIRRTRGDRRSIEVATELIDSLNTSPGLSEGFPILGYIAAGQPLEPYPDAQATLNIPVNMVPKGQRGYILQVKGQSMIDDGILDGDFVVIARQETAADGDIVVALVNGGLATLKRIYRENGKVKLVPANANMEPIYTDDCLVQGKCVGLIRRFT